MKKRIVLFLLAVVVGVGCCLNAFALDIESVADYLKTTVENPQAGSIGGEWTIMALARSGYDEGDKYFQNYYKNLEEYVKSCDGVLHSRKYTEYSRVVLALSAIGKDPENVAGYNLLLPLADFEKVIWQGTNGPAWALIALDSKNYEIPRSEEVKIQATREMYVEEILKNQKPDGGWALNKNVDSDADVTAIALTALSNYTQRNGVNEAIEKGLRFLSAIQTESGGFENFGGENSESASQVLVALSALEIEKDDVRFVKNGKTVVDNLLSFKNTDNSFRHTHDENGANIMATEQCLYALIAYDRMINGKASLYDMSDVVKKESTGSEEKNSIGEYVHKMPVLNIGKTFLDIAEHQSRMQIEQLASRGIINGKSEVAFEPDFTVTRAEFATVVVKSLGLDIISEKIFSDVSENDWYYSYIATAYKRGIVNGVSESEFNPNGVITKEEAAVMVARAAKLCEIKTDYDEFSARNILAAFIDYVSASQWARSSLAFCYDKGILDSQEIEIEPKKHTTRAEIAVMLYNLLECADLL